MARYEEVLYTKITVTYGLTKRCELTVSELPGSSPEDGTISYRKYECRSFPGSVTDRCEKENKAFCAAWTSAGYLEQLALGFAAVSLIAILFGVSTHSRRRRIWRAVVGLILLTGRDLLCTDIELALTRRHSGFSNHNVWNHYRPIPHVKLPNL